ncbi:MAG: hypothetical protein NC395_02040 [Prevotella sp.]|nr:hypothetical protein [Prevotella sp.]
MDCNKFSLEALLDCSEFVRCESADTRCALVNFSELVEKHVGDGKTADMIRDAESDYACYLFRDAFKQGFCFAVKSLKFMLGI